MGLSIGLLKMLNQNSLRVVLLRMRASFASFAFSSLEKYQHSRAVCAYDRTQM
jgi:hypothetical protein